MEQVNGKKPRARKTEQPEVKIAASAPTEELTMEERINKAMELLGITEDTLSWKRKLAAVLLTAALSFGAAYSIGSLAMYAVIGIAVLEGSMLMTVLVYTLAMLAACYAGLKIAEHVSDYVLSGQIDRDIVRAKNWVTGFFRKDETPITVH